MVRERLRIHQQAGVTTLRVSPDGQTLGERINILGELVDLVKQVNREAGE